jgi:hypothetical protein
MSCLQIGDQLGRSLRLLGPAPFASTAAVNHAAFCRKLSCLLAFVDAAVLSFVRQPANLVQLPGCSS